MNFDSLPPCGTDLTRICFLDAHNHNQPTSVCCLSFDPSCASQNLAGCGAGPIDPIDPIDPPDDSCSVTYNNPCNSEITGECCSPWTCIPSSSESTQGTCTGPCPCSAADLVAGCTTGTNAIRRCLLVDESRPQLGYSAQCVPIEDEGFANAVPSVCNTTTGTK